MPDPEANELALEWLRWSLEDLRAAKGAVESTEVQPRHVCFLAQQAAEKAMKAAFVLDQVDFPYVHDLNDLRERLPEGWEVPGEDEELEWLSRWAMEARYPGDVVASRADSERAIRLATAICDGVQQGFETKGTR